MKRLFMLFTLALCALSVWLEVRGMSPGGPALTFALGALIGVGGPIAPMLALLAVGVALGDGDTALLTPGQWGGYIALGVAVGLVCRQIQRSLHFDKTPSAWGALGLCILAAAAAALPDQHLTVMTSEGLPMTVLGIISEPELATRSALSLPLVIQSPSDLDAWVASTPLVALLLGWVCAVLSVAGHVRSEAFIPYILAGLGLLLVIPALEDLLWLASTPNVLIPDPQSLSVEFSLLGGGERGVTIEEAPMRGHADLTSRPAVGSLRIVVALCLFYAAARRWASTAPHKARPTAPDTQGSEPLLVILLGLMAAVGFSLFISVERVDLVTLWGPSPVVYSVIGGSIVAVAAAVESLREGARSRLSVYLYALTLSCWAVGLLAPMARWMST